MQSGVATVRDGDNGPVRPPAADQHVRKATRVDLATVDDPACREVLTRYDRAGVAVAVWETTSDVGLPAFCCAIAERVQDLLHPLPAHRGMGCHPTRQVALLRALAEAAQVRLTVIAGSRDDCFREDYRQLGNPDTRRRLRAQLPPGGAMRDYHAVPTFDGPTFEADVGWELDCLRAVGIERVVIVDLISSPPDLFRMHSAGTPWWARE